MVFRDFLVRLFVGMIFPTGFHRFFRHRHRCPFGKAIFLLGIQVSSHVVRTISSPGRFRNISTFYTNVGLVPRYERFFLRELCTSYGCVARCYGFRPIWRLVMKERNFVFLVRSVFRDFFSRTTGPKTLFASPLSRYHFSARLYRPNRLHLENVRVSFFCGVGTGRVFIGVSNGDPLFSPVMGDSLF